MSTSYTCTVNKYVLKLKFKIFYMLQKDNEYIVDLYISLRKSVSQSVCCYQQYTSCTQYVINMYTHQSLQDKSPHHPHGLVLLYPVQSCHPNKNSSVSHHDTYTHIVASVFTM